MRIIIATCAGLVALSTISAQATPFYFNLRRHLVSLSTRRIFLAGKPLERRSHVGVSRLFRSISASLDAT